MTTLTEPSYPGDVLRMEQPNHFCREVKTVLDGETLSVGEICRPDADGKAVACAAAANEVQTITFDAAMTAGELTITVFAPDGTPIPVSVAWNSNWATTMSDWNTAMVAAATAWYGAASNGAVMTGTATEPVLTYSGDGFSSKAIDPCEVDISGTTGPTYASVAETTRGHSAGGDAEWVALEAAAPSGADGTALMLVRGPAIVDADQLTVPTGGLTNAIAALETNSNIIARTEAEEQEIGTVDGS